MRTLLLSILILFSGNVFGQEYHSLIKLALNAYENKEYLEAGKYYENAFKYADTKYRQFNIEYCNAACVFSLAGDSKKALKYLEDAFLYG